MRYITIFLGSLFVTIIVLLVLISCFIYGASLYFLFSFFAGIAIALLSCFFGWFHRYKMHVESGQEVALEESNPQWLGFAAQETAVYNSWVSAPFTARFLFWLKTAPSERYGEGSFITELLVRLGAAWFLLAAIPYVIKSFM